jgi:tRNA-specific 2-thiouridylase
MSRTVIVAMSGGVDSSVAAAILQEQGDRVIGVGLRFSDAQTSGDPRACCGMAGIEDARRVATRLGIPFYVLDYREAFEREVIEPFCRAYARGETPNPCVLCNVALKFGALLETALAMGADYIATGHYARVVQGADGVHLLKGLDVAHDQTYFLYALTRHQLAHTLFPVGDMTKPQVRQKAAQLLVADKPGSQDICFIGAGGYRAFLAERNPETLQSGPILDLAGQLLGQHTGIAGYTVGQRGALGTAASAPLYVIAVDPLRNAVIVGPREETTAAELDVDRVSWLTGDSPTASQEMGVKVRYRGPEAWARVERRDAQAHVVWAEAQRRVAAGQAVVFYRQDRVLGGGIARVAPLL